MEKKTIGKFIAALRKANGMTQRELGEQLFVSDKTVSRWECDECTPELSLIPTIAEIFGITTDELLRGERSSPDREPAISGSKEHKQRARSDRTALSFTVSRSLPVIPCTLTERSMLTAWPAKSWKACMRDIKNMDRS